MARTYYSDVLRIYSQIIGGKNIGGVWRNSCIGFFMLSFFHERSHEVQSPTETKCYNMSGKLIRDSVPKICIECWLHRHPLPKVYQNLRLPEGKQVFSLIIPFAQSRNSEPFLQLAITIVSPCKQVFLRIAVSVLLCYLLSCTPSHIQTEYIRKCKPKFIRSSDLKKRWQME